jgi:hypothetical protein
MHFNYLKIKVIANLPYKKFRTNCPHFNQNHSYSEIYIIIMLIFSFNYSIIITYRILYIN